jgi:cell division protein FtsX
MERTVPVLGGLAQAAVFLVLIVAVRPPLYLYLATPAIAGLVGALLSDRFEKEFVDAGAAGLVGTLLSLGVTLLMVWTNTASLPLDVQIDLAFLTLMLGLFLIIVLLPVAVGISVVVGQLAVIAADEQMSA